MATAGAEAEAPATTAPAEGVMTIARRRYSTSVDAAKEAVTKASSSMAALANANFERTKCAMENVREAAAERYEHTMQSAHKIKDEVAEFILFNYEHIPDYLRSQYIHSGYRCNYTLSNTLTSLFKIHNESFNIWSHLLGFFFFLYLTFWAYETWLKDASFSERLYFSCFTVAAQMQMLGSTIFHWFGCMGRSTFGVVAKLDYTCICILIVGSCFPIQFHVFQCQPTWMAFYMVLMSALGILTLTVSWLPWFDAPQYSTLRAVTFIGLGCAGVIMVPHFLMMDPAPIGSLLRILLMGAMYIGGAIVYATKIPERWFPGKFDCFMASHNIWHLFVLIAAYTHYWTCYQVHHWRQMNPCEPLADLVVNTTLPYAQYEI